MLKWAIVFFIISILCGAFGFTSAEGVTATIAKVLFVLFLIGFIVALIIGYSVI
jgi:uncharacterized membrane protein YtjA (UPF0391 family)